MIDHVRAESQSGRYVPPGALRVVVVEDSRIIRERLGGLLADIPNLATVAYATTQDEALAILRQGEWEVVILDLQLKEGTGIRVLEELDKTTRREETTVIVFSNFDFPQYRSKAIALGADSSSTSRRNSGAFTKFSQAWREGITDHRMSGLRGTPILFYDAERGSTTDSSRTIPSVALLRSKRSGDCAVRRS